MYIAGLLINGKIKKIRLQKLEETFLIVSEIIGQTLDRAIGKVAPNSENKKMEISRLHLLISIYVPELEKDYKRIYETISKASQSRL